MPDLVVIVPSRGRPHAAQEMVEAFGSTRTSAHLVFAVDADDPTAPEYYERFGGPDTTVDTGGAQATMVRALNASAVARATSENPPFAIGFMGDDHRPRTEGWDKLYLDKLREVGTGMVYGDDLWQGSKLPTQIAMTSDIVRALGWMAPPELVHMYVDNWWMQLGLGAGCIRYLPDVVVEHVHPVTGKVDWDEGHTRVNAPAMYQRDAATFARLQATELPAAVEKVKALR